MKAQLYNSVNLFLQTSKYLHSFLSPLCKGGKPRFQTRRVNGGIFSEILAGRIKRGDSIFCGSSVGELVNVGQFFFNQ